MWWSRDRGRGQETGAIFFFFFLLDGGYDQLHYNRSSMEHCLKLVKGETWIYLQHTG